MVARKLQRAGHAVTAASSFKVKTISAMCKCTFGVNLTALADGYEFWQGGG
jgi:hypothetical protein